MRKISLSEFSKRCASQSYTKFILSTDNQTWDKIDNTMRMEFEFSSINISKHTKKPCETTTLL